MPIIVDKEKVRMDILLAFQRCIEKKPIDKVTLRDIAAEAGMSHPNVQNGIHPSLRKSNRETNLATLHLTPSSYLTERTWINGFLLKMERKFLLNGKSKTGQWLWFHARAQSKPKNIWVKSPPEGRKAARCTGFVQR